MASSPKEQAVREKSLNLRQDRFDSIQDKKVFIERIVEHWNRLPREVVKPASLGVFK